MVDKRADKQFICDFIEVYRGLPALWDAKCKEYTNRTRKGEQYDVLLEKYREKFPDAEKPDVVKKINSLRTNFRKELKRIREAEKSGAEDVEPVLWYFEEMSFLQAQETPTPSISTMDTCQETSTLDEFHEENCNEDANNGTRYTANVGPSKNTKIKKPLHPTDELIQLATRRLKQPEDDCDKVAAAWAVELRKMDPRQQMFAKKAINDILFEGQMGTLHRHSVEINASHASTSNTV
ncbi:unnamed protein product [Leptosia nina]|uniref:MADF domain-containing protein n=1 Tax=Leptosia nina TaxID=320188 RepID=A0AAV1IWW5_9NEOP